MFSTCPGLAEAFAPYAIDANAAGKEFTECRGRLATKSANYTPMMCQTFWQAFCQPRPLPTTSAAANCRGGLSPEEGHREHDSLASTPMWCSLVTRVVKPKSLEGQCDGARNAMIKELNNINCKKLWDLDDVYSLPDLLKDKHISEAMLGRVFAILGIKGEELADSLQQWKARIVFQGSNVRTKSGTSAHDIFEDVSNAPASFAAARVAMAVAAMKGLSATLRDAETAYLQALIDTPTRTPTFVELPREWWPDSWFHDGPARMQPKYIRPHCRLLRALYGHPEAGALWEATLAAIMQQQG